MHILTWDQTILLVHVHAQYYQALCYVTNHAFFHTIVLVQLHRSILYCRMRIKHPLWVRLSSLQSLLTHLETCRVITLTTVI